MFQASGTASSSSQSQAQALCDREVPLTEKQWQQAKAQLKDAIEAFEKIHKEASKKLGELKDGKADALYGPLCLGLQSVFLWIT